MTRHPLLALHSSLPLLSMMILLLLFLQQLLPIVVADGGKDGGKNPCNLTIALPMAVGYSSSQLIAITSTDPNMEGKDLEGCMCVYQVADYSVYGNKMYLTGGKAILDVWPTLEGHGLTCSSRGIIISDSQYTYLLFSMGTFFNIDKKDIVNTGGPEKPGFDIVSSMDKMTYFDYGEPADAILMTKYIYGGSSLLEAKSASKQSTYTICGADAKKGKENQTDLVATKGEKKCPFRMWWNEMGMLPGVWLDSGFSDGKNFYVFSLPNFVNIFDVDAFEGKLGQPVPFKRMLFSEFVVDGSPPAEAAPHHPDRSGGHGKGKKTAIIVVMIVFFLILCALAAIGIFCLLKRRKDKKVQSESKAKHRRKSSRKLSGSRSKSRVGGGKSRTGKQLAKSRKSSHVRKAHSKRSPPVGAATSRSKGRGLSRTTTTASRKGMSRTTSAKVSRTRTSKRPTV